MAFATGLRQVHQTSESAHPDSVSRTPNGALRPAEDGYAGVIGRLSNGELRLCFGNGLGLSGYRRIGTGWSSMTAIFTPGDFNGDGHPDVIGRARNGDLRVYFGTGTRLSGSALIGTGFGGVTALFSPGDFNLDGKSDVIARFSNGDLRIYHGNGVRLISAAVIGTGWNSLSAQARYGDDADRYRRTADPGFARASHHL